MTFLAVEGEKFNVSRVTRGSIQALSDTYSHLHILLPANKKGRLIGRPDDK
jgi:hypothetical protein